MGAHGLKQLFGRPRGSRKSFFLGGGAIAPLPPPPPPAPSGPQWTAPNDTLNALEL